MKTRVVVLLAAAAGHISTYHPSREVALAFIKGWADRHKERIRDGRVNDVETTLYQNTLDSEDPSWAIMGQYIIGMYIADDRQLSAQEKIAAASMKMAEAMEKGTSEGEEWKGSDLG